MIKPSIGRVVWFQPAKDFAQPLRDQPFAALVTYVHTDRLVNPGHYAEWMPFQKGQAVKHDSLEATAKGTA